MIPRSDSMPVSTALVERLAGLGIRVHTASNRLTTSEFFALWHEIEAQAGAMRDLGLRIGAEALAHGYSVPSLAALHAASLGDALKTMGRYKRLVCPEHVAIEVTQGEVSVRFHWILADSEVPRLLVDSTFASFAALAKVGTGTDVKPRRIELARKKADARLLSDHFGCEIRFGAPFDRIVWDESALALPFVTRDQLALSALVPDLEKALVGRSKTRSFCDDVRVAIAHHMCGARPTVANVARRMRVSQRTLQRRLEEENTSYQEQLDEVRRKTARRLLTTTELDTLEVAFLLGFVEPNSFARAFRAWTGTTPVRFRARA